MAQSSTNVLSYNSILSLVKNKDILLSIGVIFVLAMLIIPLPTVFLDFLMLVNLIAALMIILTTMYSKSVLEFSVFPTILLFSTVFRLAVNVSSTRLILTQGAGFEGKVVRTFAEFVVGGSYVIGFIIFIIITAAQFMVITKGATRVSEVSARFKLDSLPGKQMAIDADLNAGLITEKEALTRRRAIQEEADFYGNMDGATKFVSGDVRLGIVITLVNIIGGIVVGMVVRSEGFQEALQSYVMLAVGDGLVSQIPSLLVATATGVVVTRSVSVGTLGSDLSNQLFTNPKILYVTGGFVGVLGFIPGFPTVVFLSASGLMTYIGYYISKQKREEEIKGELKSEADEIKQEDEFTPEKMVDLVSVDPLEIELGYGLIPLVDKKSGGDLLERIKKSRKQIVLDLGVIVPQLRITDNMQLEADEYVIKISGGEVGRSSIKINQFLAMNTSGTEAILEGKEVIKEPVFDLRAHWIEENEKEDVEKKGFTVVDGPTIVATHLTEVIKRNAHEIMGRKEVKSILENIKKKNPSLLEEMDKLQIKVGDIQKILKELLKERVSIRNISLILEVICDHASIVSEHEMLAEYVRATLKRQISASLADKGKNLNGIVFSPELENELVNRITEMEGTQSVLNISTDILSKFIDRIDVAIKEVRQKGFDDLMIVDPLLRKPLKNLLFRYFKNLNILSLNEVADGYNINVVYTL